jgi:hypothetical protein
MSTVAPRKQRGPLLSDPPVFAWPALLRFAKPSNTGHCLAGPRHALPALLGRVQLFCAATGLAVPRHGLLRRHYAATLVAGGTSRLDVSA